MPGLPLNITAALSESGRPRRHGEQAGLTKFSRDVRKARRQPGWVTYTYGRITMNSRLTLAGVCLLAAFGLAACGGGGGGSSASMQDDTAMMPGGGMDGDEMEPAAPADLTALFAAAQDADDNAVAAGKAADGALESATENAEKLTTTEVAGDSTAAMTAAQAILQAKYDAAQAVTDAQAALDAANMAATHAEDVDADHPQKASLDAAIAAAIVTAEAELEAAEDVRDNEMLAAAVEEVTGDEDADPQGTPRSIANAVGMDIAMALLPTSSTNGGGVRHTHDTTAPVEANVPKALRFVMYDRVGQTYAEITGADRMERLGTDNTLIALGSIAGKTTAQTWANVPQAITDLGTDAATAATDGASFETATYADIPGTVYCLGDDCKVTDGKLAGSWYFAPTNPMAHWVKATDNPATTDVDESTMYTADTLFASFGHWLTSAGDPLLWTVNTFATSTITERGDLITVNTTGDTLTDSSAEYSGTAVGMSVLKADNAAGDGQDINTGRFTAKVSLTATFHATAPMLSGHVTGFAGSAVNENWRVTLQERAFGDNFTDGAAVATGRDGVWVANAYGEANQRPTGIYGGFNAHFSDGHAAGAYATRKD